VNSLPSGFASSTMDVEGFRTHYVSGGKSDGETLVLLHSGEFGACAELSWEHNWESLGEHFNILAPDFLGFGRSDKLRDFQSHGRRMITHITSFLHNVGVEKAHFIGNSVSGRFLCKVAAADRPSWPIDRMICISGGGFEPDNAERRALQEYDGSDESMRAVMSVLFHQAKWSESEEYLRRRQEFAHEPGAWEVAAAARFRAPWRQAPQMFGRPDETKYESISSPTLFVAGRHDPLLPPEYWLELASRAQKGSYEVFQKSSHCPHIEESDTFNEVAIRFLKGES
jgi:pimeloyl-ACP methyl ester carboxylesterase